MKMRNATIKNYRYLTGFLNKNLKPEYREDQHAVKHFAYALINDAYAKLNGYVKPIKINGKKYMVEHVTVEIDSDSSKYCIGDGITSVEFNIYFNLDKNAPAYNEEFGYNMLSIEMEYIR